MFKLNEISEIYRRFLKCDYSRYSPSKKINTAYSQVYITAHKKVSVISLLKIYPDINFDVLHAASSDDIYIRYADPNDIRLDNLPPIALFFNYRLTNSSGKHLEDISNAHVVS